MSGPYLHDTDQIATVALTGPRDAPGVGTEPNLTAGHAPDSGTANSVPTPDDREAWLEWRRSGVGASDVSGILGLSPWASPWSVWAEKVGLTSGQDESAAMEFGKMAEPLLKAYFEKRTGLWVLGEQTWCANPADPWMLCTVDGFVFESHCGTDDLTMALGVYEAKTTSEAPWDEVPVHYQCQANWIMAVTDMSTCWFGVLHMAFGRPDFRVYQFDRDLDGVDVKLLIGRCRSFWFDHVLTGIAPPTDAHRATTDALNAAWEAHDDCCLEGDDTLRRLVDEVAALKADVKRREDLLTERENELKASLGEATALTYGYDAKGRPVTLATWKPQDRTSIDTKALRADLPDIAAKYQTTTTSRVLRIKPSKGN